MGNLLSVQLCLLATDTRKCRVHLLATVTVNTILAYIVCTYIHTYIQYLSQKCADMESQNGGNVVVFCKFFNNVANIEKMYHLYETVVPFSINGNGIDGYGELSAY